LVIAVYSSVLCELIIDPNLPVLCYI
jgi:hypothetical protein